VRRHLLVACALGILPAVLDAQRPDTTRTDTVPRRLAGVVVSGTRLSDAADERTPVQVDVLDVQTAPPGPSRAQAALARIPGVSVFDDQGNRSQPTLDVRGFQLSPVVGVPQGVSVFLDGVRINEPDAQQVYFDLIPMDAVERAELVRGPVAVFGKNTLAGALLLFTERGRRRTDIAADVAAGPSGFRSARVSAGGMRAGFDFYGLLSGSDDDGYRRQAFARTRSLFANIGRRGERGDIALSVLFARDSIQQAGSLPASWLAVDRRANYTGGDFVRPELLHVALRGKTDILGGSLEANVYNRSNDVEQFNVNVDDPDTRAFVRTNATGATVELSRPLTLLGRALTLTVGAEGSRNDIQYRVLNEPNEAAPTLPPDCDQTSGLCERARVLETNAALFAQGTLVLSPHLSLTGAARADYVRVPFRDERDPEHSGTSTFRRISPRLGVNVEVGDVRGYAAIGSGFRAPAALELACADESAPCPLPFSLGDDPPLDPVRIRTYEAGVDIEPTTALALDVVAFRSDVRDEIVFVASQSAAGFFQNVPRTRRLGVEASARASLPSGVRASISYAFVDATYRSTVQLASAIEGAAPAEPGDRFPLSPRHRVAASLGATRGVGEVTLDGELSARRVSSQFLRGDEANDFAPLDGYTLADLRVAARHRWIELTLGVTNLFGRRVETFGIYGENPRGPIGTAGVVAPGVPSDDQVERFLTPGYPRTLSVALTLRRPPSPR
jgi:outer membrane cobalamin receptor